MKTRWQPNLFGIYVPSRGGRGEDGFISPALLGAVAGSARRTAAFTPQYFGACNSAGNPLSQDGTDFYGSMYGHNNEGVVAYTCPGTGSRTATSIGLRCYGTAGTADIRLAIYNSNRTAKMYEMSAVKNTSGTSTAWWGEDISLTETTKLTGGSNYVLAWTTNSSNMHYAYHALASGQKVGYGTSYTAGFPSSLTVGASTVGHQTIMRVYVT